MQVVALSINYNHTVTIGINTYAYQRFICRDTDVFLYITASDSLLSIFVYSSCNSMIIINT